MTAEICNVVYLWNQRLTFNYKKSLTHLSNQRYPASLLYNMTQESLVKPKWWFSDAVAFLVLMMDMTQDQCESRVKCIHLKLQNVFVSNCKMYLSHCKMYLSQIVKCICFILTNVFVLYWQMYLSYIDKLQIANCPALNNFSEMW